MGTRTYLCLAQQRTVNTDQLSAQSRDLQCIGWTSGETLCPRGRSATSGASTTHGLMPDSDTTPMATNRPWFTDMILADSLLEGGQVANTNPALHPEQVP